MKYLLTLCLLSLSIAFTGCAEQKAGEIYEIAQFEELQENWKHANQLYKEIIFKYPETEVASKAKKQLAKLLKEQLKTHEGGPMKTDISKIDFSSFDNPGLLSFLFHPRKESPGSLPLENAEDILIPVGDNEVIGAKLHHGDKKAPTILFFHGNGEIVSDYDDLGPLYTEMNINFLPVDYRGYGRSTGTPTVTSMMRDCHFIFDYIKKWLESNSYTGPVIIMGRSLGSASALELASAYPEEFSALVIESGFAYAVPLLRLLGVNIDAMGIKEENGFRNIEKVKNYTGPTLVIHAEYDHIIPYSDGKALFDACPASIKKLLKIPDANHNTIFAIGLKEYMKSVKEIVEKASK